MDNFNGAFEGNRESWNKRSEIHFNSNFYNNESFLKGKTSLTEIELGELGDVKGKSLLHLQCHFGQDTLSFARMGARVTGVDLSDKGIEYANILKDKVGLEADFLVSNIYNLKENLSGKFDIVFTSFGVLGWLPDLEEWAEIIFHFLKDGGVFYIAEFHPIVWTFDSKFEFLEYPYLKSEMIVDYSTSTYGDTSVKVSLTDYNWNHGLSEVINAMIKSGLKIEFLNEHNFSPYNIFENGVEVSEGRFMVRGIENRIPLVYSIRAVKKL